jgi:hypothetical protein
VPSESPAQIPRAEPGVEPACKRRTRNPNFDRPFVLLREVCERGVASLSQLEREGAVQRFEFAFELAWKTLKDYLEENGVIVDPVTPCNVINRRSPPSFLTTAKSGLT